VQVCVLHTPYCSILEVHVYASRSTLVMWDSTFLKVLGASAALFAMLPVLLSCDIKVNCVTTLDLFCVRNILEESRSPEIVVCVLAVLCI